VVLAVVVPNPEHDRRVLGDLLDADGGLALGHRSPVRNLWC
jgi:hypothetical protein